MKNRVIYTILSLLSFCLLAGSCKDDGAEKVEKISLIQTQYDPEGNELVLRIMDNEVLQLIPLIFPVDAENKSITYENADHAVMEVSADGLLTGKSPGEDILTMKATDGSGVVQSYKVYVKDHQIKTEDLGFSEEEITVETNGTIDIGTKVVFTPSDVWDKSLTFVSSDPGIATVGEDGILRGVKAGTTTITVTTIDGTNISASCPVTVSPDLYRKEWQMEVTPKTGFTGADFPNLIDDDITSFISIPKPVRHADGPPEGVPWGFIIDLGASKTFNYFRLSHRNDQLGLRARKLSFLGSNDGENYTPIDPQGISIQYEPQSFLTIDDQPLAESTYRYVKIIFDEWDKDNNSVIQITEFYL
ncbi:MAG: Ig-like domain-containing protein, partial [Bacteroides sp.]|nr:Ig-like domain-containing protein [Bacteroides sp.]